MIVARRTAARTAIAAGTMAAAVLTALSGASAAHASATGYVTAIGCTGVTGSVSYTPGLKINASRATTATLSATTSGCADSQNALPGNGTLSAVLTGTSSYGHVSESGQFVINWPSFYNPSSGALSVTGPAADGSYAVSGRVTAGAFTGDVVSTRLFVTGTNPGATGRKGHLLTTQNVVNSLPLTLQYNGG